MKELKSENDGSSLVLKRTKKSELNFVLVSTGEIFHLKLSILKWLIIDLFVCVYICGSFRRINPLHVTVP